jgi:heme-degrading monooxygenase HmoA
MSIVKINALTVPDEMRETLEKRFAARAGAVENSDGFEWFELLRPVEGKYLVYTRWRSEDDFQSWMSGPMQAAHRGGGEGGADRPRPASSDSALWSFEVVQQAAPKG